MSSGPFAGTPLGALRAMIAHADASGLDAVASRWSAIHDALRQAQDDLLHHTLAATDHWTGSAADAFTSRADELHRSLGNGAAYAFNASSGVSLAADALRTAQSTMPADPDPLEQAATCAATGTCGEPSPLMLQRQREAAAVMDRLEQRYRAAGEMIGTPAEFSAGADRGVFPPAPSAKRRSEPHSDLSRSGAPIDQPSPRAGLSHASVRLGNSPSGPSTADPHLGTQQAVLGGAGSAGSTPAWGEASSHTGPESISLPHSSGQASKIRWPADSTEDPPNLELSHLTLRAASGKSTPLPFHSDPLLGDSPTFQSDPITASNGVDFNDMTSQIGAAPGASGDIGRGYSASGISANPSLPEEGLPNNPRAEPWSPGINSIAQQGATDSSGALATGSLIPQSSAPDLRRRARRTRPAYLIECGDAWASDAEWNPAVIE